MGFQHNNPGVQTGDEFDNTEETALRNIADNGVPTKTTFTSYAAGTAYSLTATAAQVVFGTTSPAITLTSAGTYLILSRAKVDYNAATFAAVRTATMKLRRTNNTAADVSGASTTVATQILTLLTFTAASAVLPPVFYTTTNTDDVIQMYGSISVLPTAGTMDVTSAEIVAVKLY